LTISILFLIQIKGALYCNEKRTEKRDQPVPASPRGEQKKGEKKKVERKKNHDTKKKEGRPTTAPMPGHEK
jgi:hypothetical protein